MCAQFLVKYDPLLLCQEWQITPVPHRPQYELILPYRVSNVIVGEKMPREQAEIQRYCIKPMNYSLIPHWSKEKRVKFATHNARLDSIDTKPTWRRAFVRNHCVIPLTDFIEPIYVGSAAGTMVRFSPQSQTILYAAGIWDCWCDQQTALVIESFAIITKEASPFIASVGHPRMPLLLAKNEAKQWLMMIDRKPQELKDFLNAAQYDVDFTVTKERDLKSRAAKKQNTSGILG